MPGPLHGYRIVDLTSNDLGAARHHDARRPGRRRRSRSSRRDGGDHTRAGANRRGGFSASFLNNNRNKRSVALEPEDAGGARGLDAAGRRRRTCSCRISAPASPSGWASARTPIRAVAPRDRLRLDQRLRRAGAVCEQAGLRPAGAGGFGAGDDAGRLRRGAAPPGAHHRARQADRDHRRRRRSPRRCWRASAPARASMCGSPCSRRCSRFCGRPTWAARPLSGDESGTPEAASFIDLIYETADGYITAAVQTNRNGRR